MITISKTVDVTFPLTVPRWCKLDNNLFLNLSWPEKGVFRSERGKILERHFFFKHPHRWTTHQTLLKLLFAQVFNILQHTLNTQTSKTTRMREVAITFNFGSNTLGPPKKVIGFCYVCMLCLISHSLLVSNWSLWNVKKEKKGDGCLSS